MMNMFVNGDGDETVRFIQVTDPHLFKSTQGELLGINTQASLDQVLQEIQSSDFNYQFVLATGDLVQDSSEQGYRRFCESINRLKRTVFWIPGNHDFQPKMFEILNQSNGNINPAKRILAGKFWQILMLDSQVFGVPYGQLGQYQLDWLQAKLQEHPERYSLIVLHHHILSTHSVWLDQHNLRNAHELAYVLSAFPNVKGIMYGHIHQQVDDEWKGYKMMATASTCIQFKPHNNMFTLDTLQPGWREVELHADGTIKTQVKRIHQAVFLPNMNEEGYE